MQYIQETDIKWSMKFQVKTMDSYFPVSTESYGNYYGLAKMPSLHTAPLLNEMNNR